MIEVADDVGAPRRKATVRVPTYYDAPDGVRYSVALSVPAPPEDTDTQDIARGSEPQNPGYRWDPALATYRIALPQTDRFVSPPPMQCAAVAPLRPPATAPPHAGRHCALCGGAGSPAGHREGVLLRTCCGALLAWAWDTEEQYEAWYRHPDAYPVTEQRANGQLPLPHRRAEQEQAAQARLASLTALCPLPPGARLLDVGAGTGAFVEVAARSFRAAGIDPCPTHVQAAQARGTPLFLGEWLAVQGRWDVITLFDVLEHLTRPLECLRHLRSCLELDGLLVIEVPEWESPDQRRHGLDWKHIRPRQHLWLPSRAAAEALFARAGCEVLAFWRPLRGTLGKASWILTGMEGC